MASDICTGFDASVKFALVLMYHDLRHHELVFGIQKIWMKTLQSTYYYKLLLCELVLSLRH